MRKELYQGYLDKKSILVSTPKNQLIRIFCPFLVKNTESEVFQVDEVVQNKHQNYYKIKGKFTPSQGLVIQLNT